MSKTVLMCGGPADGWWVVVDDPSRDWEVQSLPKIQWAGDPTTVSEPRRYRYKIYSQPLLGETMWVGVALSEDIDPMRVIMRAILQRDVAQHLGAYR